MLGQSKHTLLAHLVSNDLKPITDCYYVVIKNDDCHPENNVTDLYIGINGNIV
ncbi:MAG: hypothetical protein QM689_11620 [Oscillospiraceae bacterium]